MLQTADKVTCGVLSDTHGRIHPQIIEALYSCDVILHAGDIGSKSVLTELNEICKNVFAVAGNNDTPQKWPPGEHNDLRALPDTLQICLAGHRLVVTHGHQYTPVARRYSKLRSAFADADIIIYGHSHRLNIDQSQQPWVINPGAAGNSRTYGGASCIKLFIDRAAISFSEFRAGHH